MYFVKYGKNYLHDPRVEDCVLLNLSIESSENSCGFCDFTIYPTHPMYDKLRERDADNPIEVYDDDILLFAGFIYELGKEFYLDGHVKCKGELDYLNESIVRSYSTHNRGFGSKAPDSVNGLFEWYISQHNSQVDTNKQFTVGINQGAALDENNYIFRESDQYPTTFKELTEKLLNINGGYLRVRHENNVRYIDYLSEWVDTNTQLLDFGVNLTNYTQTDDSEEMATYVVPRGAVMSETQYDYDDGYYPTQDTTVDPDKEYYIYTENGFSKCSDLTKFTKGVTYYEYYEDWDESNNSLTIDGYTDGLVIDEYMKSGDMVYHEPSVKKYGWIGTTVTDSDITLKSNLVYKGILTLKEFISPKRTIEIKAVDMHLINKEIKPIKVGEYVRVRSIPHNLDSYFLCRSIDLNLNNPEQSLYTLGTTFDTLTGQQNKKINELNSTINTQYEKATALSEEAKKEAKDASTSATQAHMMARLKSRTYLVTPETPYDEGDSWVRENTSVLSHADEIKMGSIWTCIKSRSEDEVFHEEDWVLTSTDDQLAEDALTVADEAKATADGVDAKATAAQTAAESASTSASNALTAAQTAQSTAESASTDASNALTTAQTAQSTADGVDAKATAAQTAAESAQSTANEAKATAETAVSSVGELEESVSNTYVKTTDLQQTTNAFTMNFNTLQKTVTENQQGVNETFAEWTDYIKFIDGDIVLGKSGNSVTCRISNNRISFIQNDAEVAYLSDNRLNIHQAQLTDKIQIGNFALIAREDGGLSISKSYI